METIQTTALLRSARMKRRINTCKGIEKKTMEHESDVYTSSALGTVTEGLLKEVEDLEIRGRMETIQTTTLLRLARILRRVLETWGDLLYNFSKRPSANADVKNF